MPTSRSTELRPDSGSISGDVYANQFFDFTYEFPKGWIPHGEATNKQIMETARERVLSSQPGHEAEVNVEAKHTYNLLTVFENELGTPGVRFFRSEVLVAEDVSFAPGIKNGKDYLLNALPILKMQGYTTFSEIKSIDLGGVTFYQEDLTRRISQDITVHQTQFSTVLRGYALVIGIATEDADETEKLVNTLSLRFGQKGLAAESAPAQVESVTLNPQEAGSMEGETYRNNYFGLNYCLPDGWYVDTRIFREKLKETTGRTSGSTSKNFVLLSANEFEPGTPGVGFNPVIMLMADNSSAYHPALKAKDYLPKITRSFEAQNVLLVQQGAELNVGPHRFYRADYKRPNGYQAVLCTDWKGFVFTWMFVAQTMPQLDLLVNSLGTASF